MSNASEYSKPPSGRRHKAKIFYQENNFFEKTSEKTIVSGDSNSTHSVSETISESKEIIDQNKDKVQTSEISVQF